MSIALRQGLRDGILATDREALRTVARRHLLDRFDQSAVGVLAGDALLEISKAGLDQLGLRHERL
jgi:hypothetical protein